MLTQDAITNALKSVRYPGYSRDIVSFGLVKHVAVNAGAVNLTLELTSHNAPVAAQLKQDCESTLKELPGVKHLFVEVKMPAAPPGATAASPSPFANQNKVPGLKRIVAV